MQRDYDNGIDRCARARARLLALDESKRKQTAENRYAISRDESQIGIADTEDFSKFRYEFDRLEVLFSEEKIRTISTRRE
jgi:hypothetical protein